MGSGRRKARRGSDGEGGKYTYMNTELIKAAKKKKDESSKRTHVRNKLSANQL